MNKIPADPVFAVDGKVVAITGACGLIGRAMVAAFAQRGAKLILVDVPSADPQTAAAACGAEALGIAGDVSKAEEVATILDTAVKRFGGVDVLINNHQYKPQGFLEARAETFPEELWDAIIDVNLKGTFLTCRDFGRHMLERGKGSIVNLASTYGVVSSNPILYADNAMGNPLAYTASKGGVVMLSKYLAVYWAKRGVRVNCLTPHGVSNNHEQAFIDRFSSISPMGRLMRAEEIVGATLFLASDASSYVTGSNVLVEGGWTSW
jgi:NAD(P)-dependent dehydrogenase (short-subunit alcohol dehydrogenase family)